jgi:hypothetical protein
VRRQAPCVVRSIQQSGPEKKLIEILILSFKKTSRPHYSPKKLRNALKTAKEKQVGFWDKTEQVTNYLRTVVVNL